MRNNIVNIVSIVVALIILAVVAFIMYVAISAGIDGVSFVDKWNAIFGITAAPVDPELPEEVAENLTN